jgi:peptide/nickel transport system substrate-binding protein/oligopeptide transport system substrate-binding protein
MQHGKKLTFGVLPAMLCLVVLMLSACGSISSQGSQDKASSDKQTFIYSQTGASDIATFDPALATDATSNNAISLVFTGLVTLDDQLQIKPQIAQSWQRSADGQTWTFHLKPNLKFSDGTPLTSKDVAYSIDRALQKSLGSVTSPTYLGLIKDSDKLLAGQIKTIIGDSVLTPDPQTVVLITNSRAAYFLDTLTYSTSYVVEKKLIDKYGNNFTNHLTEGGSSGPYVVKEYDQHRQIIFTPNPNYYGPKPQIQKIIMPFFVDPATAFKTYQTGRVDYTPVPSENNQDVKSQPDFYKVAQLSTVSFAMNYLIKPFDNIKVRQGMALALNKDAIVHAIWKDTNIATNHIVPQGIPGYNSKLTTQDNTNSTKGNPTLARQLFDQGLREEGYSSPDQLPTIHLTYQGGSKDIDREIAASIQMWQNVLGISIKPEAVDFNKFLDELAGTANNPKGLQMWRENWLADYPDPQDWLTLQFGKGAANNAINFGQNSSTNAASQQLLQNQMANADSNPNAQARMENYNAIEQQVINDVGWLPIYQYTTAYQLKSYVHGLHINELGLIAPDDWANIYITQH